MAHIISGIQQIGIGVANVHKAFNWYNKHLGIDIPVFEEAAEAGLMLPYTGGEKQQRHAILAMNIKGGGGFEIWQYTSRTPQAAAFEIQAGDLGIFCTRIKTDNVEASFNFLKKEGVTIKGGISNDPAGRAHFFIEDPFGNLFEISSDDEWFSDGIKHTGGVAGAIIGVSDIEKSIHFYSEILGYDKILYKGEAVYDDFSFLKGGSEKIQRVILTHSEARKGPFSGLLGNSSIELIKVVDRTAKKMFENRFWGDLGFIHLCFDVRNMADLKSFCGAKGHAFTVDGGEGFEMGEASGHFAYIEDPDGTLIEFVETKKVPILKKFNWYLDLRKRADDKRLPNWMLKALKFNRKKAI
jgi:catechol 2,3-dioxygenase-like lactoylglutathione lyase family enzyme